jgi:hypothetical protein
MKIILTFLKEVGIPDTDPAHLPVQLPTVRDGLCDRVKEQSL